MRSILIVEDDDQLRPVLSRYFEKIGYGVFVAPTGRAAKETLDRVLIDLVLLDLRLPDIHGLEVLSHIKQTAPGTLVIVMSGLGEIKDAVSAIKAGAEDFLQKPFDLANLSARIEQSLVHSQDRQRIAYLRKKLTDLTVGSDSSAVIIPEACVQTLSVLEKHPSATVLLQGETGTGKGVMARLIHQLGARGERDFVDINCASLDPGFTESELFGHERGAFTDAKAAKPGLMEIAHGGTLFLDEIAELELSVQGKLLKVLEDKSFRRMGGTRTLTVDLRFIAASNRDLEVAVGRGSFRQDLFYRLSVFPVRIPPLRERREDILPLTQMFLQRFSRSMHHGISDVTPEAGAALRRYAWPGNIRELRNAIERAAIMETSRQIQLNSLPEAIRKVSSPASQVACPEALRLESVEARHIRQVIEMCGNNRTKAAALLGIHRVTLLRKLAKYGLEAGPAQ